MNSSSQCRLYLTEKKGIEQDIRKLHIDLEYTIFHQTNVDAELEKNSVLAKNGFCYVCSRNPQCKLRPAVLYPGFC